MIRQLAILFIPGILTGFVTAWILGSWSGFNSTVQVIISIVIGGLTVALLFILSTHNRIEQSSSEHTNVASNLEAKQDVGIGDMRVTELPPKASIASNIKSKSGKITIKNLVVGEEKEEDATS